MELCRQRWSQDGADMGQDGANMGQDEGNIRHLQLGPGTLKIDGARTGQQAGIRGGQDGCRDGTKVGQDRAKMAPR